MDEIINSIPEMEIIVDDGFRKIPVKNTNGEQIGVFYFNPSDIGIIERYNRLADSFDQITAPLEAEAPEGATDEEKDAFNLKCLSEATERLYTACNDLFGGNFSEAFFGRTNPFSPSNGKFYCENALENVGKFISKAFDSEVKKVEGRVNKYTAKYNRAQRRAKK